MTPSALCPDCGAAMQDRGDGLECPACGHVQGWEPIVASPDQSGVVPPFVQITTHSDSDNGPYLYGLDQSGRVWAAAVGGWPYNTRWQLVDNRIYPVAESKAKS